MENEATKLAERERRQTNLIHLQRYSIMLDRLNAVYLLLQEMFEMTDPDLHPSFCDVSECVKLVLKQVQERLTKTQVELHMVSI